MAIATKPAPARVSYEELIIDILVTKSLVFSVVGLDVPGLAFAHRLAENGYATIGIVGSRLAGEGPIARDATGILRLGNDLEEIAASDVVLSMGTEVGAGARFQALLPHLGRGQVLFTHACGDSDLVSERRLIEEAAGWGLAIGKDFFVVYLPEKGLSGSGSLHFGGATEVCSRVGNAIYAKVLRCLA